MLGVARGQQSLPTVGLVCSGLADNGAALYVAAFHQESVFSSIATSRSNIHGSVTTSGCQL
jgi:hypothetical protein